MLEIKFLLTWEIFIGQVNLHIHFVAFLLQKYFSGILENILDVVWKYDQ